MWKIVKNLPQPGILLLFFIGGGAQSAAKIYFNALFLLSYPVKWLIYFSLSSMLLGLLFSQVIGKLITQGSYKQQFILLLGLLLPIGFFPFYLNIPGVAFVFCLYIYLVNNLFITLCYTAAAGLLDIRTYKNLAHTFAASFTIGCVLASFVPLLLSSSLKMNGLLVVMLVMGSMEAMLIFWLRPSRANPPSPLASNDKGQGLKHFTAHPLAKYCFGWVLIIVIATYIVDFIFKYQLTLHHNAAQITDVLSLLSGGLNLVILLAQVFLLKILIARYGQKILGLTIIVIGLICSGCYLIYPSFATALILFFLVRFVDYGFMDILTGIRLIPLPIQVRNLTNMLLKNVANPLGNAISAFVIFICTLSFIPSLLTQYLLALGCLLIFILGWFINHELEKKFQTTLIEALKSRRFKFNDETVSLTTYPTASVQLSDLSMSRAETILLLDNKSTVHYAGKLILQLGDKGLPLLNELINMHKFKLAKIGCRLLTSLNTEAAERAILVQAKSSSILLRLQLAKHSFINLQHQPRKQNFSSGLYQLILDEARIIQVLQQALWLGFPPVVENELKLRLQLSSLTLLYWFGCYTHSSVIEQIIPIIQNKAHRIHQARFNHALELLDSLASDSELRRIIKLFEQSQPQAANLDKLQVINNLEPIIRRFIMVCEQEANMQNAEEKLIILRKVKLFNQLPLEIITAISEEAVWRHVTKDEVIFREGDDPDGFYMLATGKVSISRNNQVLSILNPDDFFGEIGLLYDSPRLASAIAEEESDLLYIDNLTFDNLANDIPDIMRVIAGQIVSYLQNTLLQMQVASITQR